MANNRLGYERTTARRGGGWLTRALAATIGILVLGLILAVGLAFSIVVIPIVLLAVLIGGGVLWFKTRGLRREFRQQVDAFKEAMPSSRGSESVGSSREGTVIDGEDFIKDAQSASESNRDRVSRD